MPTPCRRLLAQPEVALLPRRRLRARLEFDLPKLQRIQAFTGVRRARVARGSALHLMNRSCRVSSPRDLVGRERLAGARAAWATVHGIPPSGDVLPMAQSSRLPIVAGRLEFGPPLRRRLRARLGGRSPSASSPPCADGVDLPLRRCLRMPPEVEPSSTPPRQPAAPSSLLRFLLRRIGHREWCRRICPREWSRWIHRRRRRAPAPCPCPTWDIWTHISYGSRGFGEGAMELEVKSRAP
jgi:hypothetical protein